MTKKFSVPPVVFSSATTTRYNSSASSSDEKEKPLLEELGIHPDKIWKKTKAILNPFRINPSVHKKDSDLSGPFFLYLGFCLFQLLAGKIQFGFILGWTIVSSIFLYVVEGRKRNLDLHTCTSVVGYSMLPLVILSAVSLFVPRAGVLIAAVVFVVWATMVCTGLIVALADNGEEHRGLVACPCFLIYTLFSLLVIF